MSQDGVVCPHISPSSIDENRNGTSEHNNSDGNTPESTNNCRSRGKKPDPLTLMMLQMKQEADARLDEKEERRHEQEDRAANHAALTQLVGTIAAEYFKDKRREKKDKREKKMRKRKSKRAQRRGLNFSSSSSSSSSSSDSSISSFEDAKHPASGEK